MTGMGRVSDWQASTPSLPFRTDWGDAGSCRSTCIAARMVVRARPKTMIKGRAPQELFGAEPVNRFR